jgi:hypothetical protein
MSEECANIAKAGEHSQNVFVFLTSVGFKVIIHK